MLFSVHVEGEQLIFQVNRGRTGAPQENAHFLPPGSPVLTGGHIELGSSLPGQVCYLWLAQGTLPPGSADSRRQAAGRKCWGGLVSHGEPHRVFGPRLLRFLEIRPDAALERRPGEGSASW